MAPSYDVEKFRDEFEHEYTWLNGFLRNVARFGDKPAAYDPETGTRWTYKRLNEDANRLSNAILQDGAKKGDILMYMLFNSPEFLFCYLAGHKTGTVGTPVNFRYSGGELAMLLDDSKPEFLVFGEDFADSARQALQKSGHKPRRIIFAGKGNNIQEGETLFSDYIENMPRSNPKLPFRHSIYDETNRFYTSGTTNTAKAVPNNSINELLSAHDVMMHFPLNSTDRTMNMTPWFHRGGLHSGGPCPTLYAGGQVIILREFNPKRCLAIAEREQVSFLIGVPSIIALLARQQEYAPVDLGSLKGIVTMGSPFDKKDCQHYMEIFTTNIFNGYGTTETFWNTFLRPCNLPEYAGSAGMACTDDDVRVIRQGKDGGHGDPDDLVARDNMEVGEVIIKSPAKSAGSYVNNTEMTARKFHMGFHYTGDLATWDKNSFITIVSRKDDMIISAGENIYPTPIEAAIREHPKVAECAVVGQAARLHGQSVAAYIVPSDPSLTVEELKRHCQNHPMLPAFKRPRYYYIVDKLPHTATGKIMHYKIRQNAADSGNPKEADE